MASALKEKIMERMEAKNLSIAELERRAGLSIHSVRNILKGRIKKPSAQSLQAIAEALECSILDLMNSAPTISGGFSPQLQGRMRKRSPLDYPDLMLNCSKKILDLITDKKLKVSVDEYLDVVKKVYFYSSREEPRKFDTRFAEWLIETQFDDQKPATKG
ncbi:MAG TPA: helix-turn-helix transcriptional regulator [Alphaproteobacteria bacterium]|nr:helix-turn-helix transcriptional regulator [Alphaproteobacteria bacterium]